jgi:cardiolipin synthase
MFFTSIGIPFVMDASLVDLFVALAFGIMDFFVILFNIVTAIVIVFLERRKPTTALAWLMILFFIPLLGFILYLFFGRHLYKDYVFQKKTEADLALIKKVDDEGAASLPPGPLPAEISFMERFRGMVPMLMRQGQAGISFGNDVVVYTDGKDKFEALLNAIRSAQTFVHIEYYLVRNDECGRKLVSELAAKAREGVEVRFLVDAVGAHSLPKTFFQELTDAGGKVAVFFPFLIPFLNLRINHRNHRKILVVDGTVGLLGGFNIGKEYLGKGPLGYWRDTHLLIRGPGIKGLETRFIMDWNHSSKDRIDPSGRYYPVAGATGTTALQIVSSGPDNPEMAIRDGFVSLIGAARESVYIQTPYLVPDDLVFQVLSLAARSGLDVRIIIPCKPDHPFVFWSSHSYLGDLIDSGVRGYTYEKGFIHSKTIVIDGIAGSVGTANWDIRSFSLNFETNAFFYDPILGKKMKEVFLADLSDCSELTRERYASRSTTVKIKEGVSRLLSYLQ